MYLFLHHICFYSNISGYETEKTIPLQEVTDVRKAKTAAIFPNAIEIIAGSKRHFFGSFLSRNEAYQIIVDGWEQHVSDARVLLERQNAKSASCSEENGYILLEGAKESTQQEDSSALDRSPVSAAVRSTESGDSEINISKRFSKVQEDGLEDNTVELNPFSLGPVDDDAPNVLKSYTMITESKLQVSVEVLYNILFSDAAFGFVDGFHKKCSDKGAKFGTCQEVQKLQVYKNRHMMIKTSQSIGDAPYVTTSLLRVFGMLNNTTKMKTVVSSGYTLMSPSQRKPYLEGK